MILSYLYSGETILLYTVLIIVYDLRLFEAPEDTKRDATEQATNIRLSAPKHVLE